MILLIGGMVETEGNLILFVSDYGFLECVESLCKYFSQNK